MTRSDRFTDSSIKSQLYSDFLTDLNKHPVSGDVVRFVNETAVIRSIKNLLMTDKGERHYQPDLGSNIRKMLFELGGSGTEQELISLVRETIEKHEPRAKIVDVAVIPDLDNNKYTIALMVLILNQQDPVSMSVTLTRVR